MIPERLKQQFSDKNKQAFKEHPGMLAAFQEAGPEKVIKSMLDMWKEYPDCRWPDEAEMAASMAANQAEYAKILAAQMGLMA